MNEAAHFFAGRNSEEFDIRARIRVVFRLVILVETNQLVRNWRPFEKDGARNRQLEGILDGFSELEK